MRTLSIRQPWAWLIVNGFKDIENRDWETLYRGPVLVHAGKTMAKRYHAEVAEWVKGEFDIDVPGFDALPRGGIVGLMTIVGCVRESESPWFNEGSFGFVVRDAKPLPFHACNGALKFFDVPRCLDGAGSMILPA